MTTVSETSNGQLEVTFRDGLKITLKKPDRSVLGQALSASAKDPLGAADVIFNRLVVEGDKALLRSKTGYAHQIITVMDDVFGKVPCMLTWESGKENLEDTATLEFADGVICTLHPPSRQQYAAARAAAKVNPLRFAEDLLRGCLIDSTSKIDASAGHLLGFVEVAEELVSYTGGHLGN